MVETLWKGRNSREQIKGGCLFWSFFSFLELISIFLSIWYNKIRIHIILLHSVFIWSNLVEKWPQTRNTKTRDSLDFARFFAGFVQKTIVNCPRLQWSAGPSQRDNNLTFLASATLALARCSVSTTLMNLPFFQERGPLYWANGFDDGCRWALRTATSRLMEYPSPSCHGRGRSPLVLWYRTVYHPSSFSLSFPSLL